MATAGELLKAGKTRELWEKYCGFVDLSVQEFMEIQNCLLLEQLELLNNCEMTVKIMQGVRPTTMEEFREQVPFTTYEAYLPYLQERREDILPVKPLVWVRTSGRSGEYPFKWAPMTERLYEEAAKCCVAYIILSACKGRHDIALEVNDKLFYGMAPPPYPTGAYAMATLTELPLNFMPPPNEAEALDFQERIRRGISQSLSQGLDFVFGLSSVLVAIGSGFAERSGGGNILPLLRRPRALLRLTKGLVKSKLARRPMLPKDLWNIKGVMGAGMDASVFRDRIRHYWGKYPLDCYACAEIGIMAMQTWDFGDMVFLPTTAFFEFIPEEEHWKSKKDKNYQPRTVLLDEVEAGNRYEIVATSYYGVPFIRYRIGDMLQVNALRNAALSIELPQISFHSRCDDIIDIGGFTRLTEKIIWQAIETSGVAYRDWVIRKEVGDNPFLHLYLEPKDPGLTAGDALPMIHQKLRELDEDYRNVEDMLSFDPLKVTILPQGAFERYTAKQRAAGADIAHLKPRHLSPPDEVLDVLMSMPKS